MSVKLQTVDEYSQNQRLDNYLLKHLKGVPKSRIYRIIRKGEVRVNKGRKNPDYKLQIDDIVRIPPIRISENKTILANDNLQNLLKKSIIYEDESILIINKPAKLAVHGGSNITLGVIDVIRQMYNSNLELVHRLDRATSGCLLIAKKRSTLRHLNQQLAKGEMSKTYIALVGNNWAKKRHTIDAPLLSNSRQTVIDSQGKSAISHFHPLKNFKFNEIALSLVDVSIETGRTHQIRAHALYTNHPIAGDQKYGDDNLNQKLAKLGLKRLFLHAHKLSFTHPITNKLTTITANLSDELETFLQKL